MSSKTGATISVCKCSLSLSLNMKHEIKQEIQSAFSLWQRDNNFPFEWNLAQRFENWNCFFISLDRLGPRLNKNVPQYCYVKLLSFPHTYIVLQTRWENQALDLHVSLNSHSSAILQNCSIVPDLSIYGASLLSLWLFFHIPQPSLKRNHSHAATVPLYNVI